MAGLFSRLKIWNPGEALTANDLNAEFNQFLANIDAVHSEGYSVNLNQMQTQTNPGGLGTENLTQPISVADEIQRLRYVISRIVGKGYWYEGPAQSLDSINTAVDSIFNLTPSRVNTGLKTALSGFPTYLQANGAAGVKLNASVPQPFACSIDNTVLSLTADVSSGLLSFAPLSNTATLASSFGGNQASQEATEFTISAAGASIVALVGKQAIFQINNGTFDEYFLGTVQSSTSITGIRRGYFRNTSNASVPPITLTTGHTITLLRTTYVFLKNDGTLSVTYNPPTTNGPAPSSPSTGDYWFDRVADRWKVYTGTFVNANAIFVGMCAQNASQTICARSEKFFLGYSEINELNVDSVSTNSIESTKDIPTQISVNGAVIDNKFQSWFWDMTVDMFPGESENSSTRYYFYLNENGNKYITSIAPVFELDLRGFYHPYERLRCVASAFNDGPSSLILPIHQYFETTTEEPKPVPAGTINAYGGVTAPLGYLLCDGARVSRLAYRDLFTAIGTAYGSGDGSTSFNLPDLRGQFLRGVASVANVLITGVAGNVVSFSGGHGIKRSGFPVRFTGSVPTGLNTTDTFFCVYINDTDLSFATSHANAVAASPVIQPLTSTTTGGTMSQYADPDAATRLASSTGGNSGNAIGSYQEDIFESHRHSYARPFQTAEWETGADPTDGWVNSFTTDQTGFTGGNESRPQNIYVNFIIKV